MIYIAIIAAFCFGFSLAVLLNTRIHRDYSPIRSVSRALAPVQKRRAIIPGRQFEEEDDEDEVIA